MKAFRRITILVVLVAVLASCTGIGYKEGRVYYGFRLEKKEFVKELNCDVLQFRHVRSGARLVKIAATDNNKFFSITFFTTPDDDSGVSHIMEHSVLNGSQNFPVKSPFDIMRKGSLNTFLNAMTGADLTTYPIASMNEKDYFNLMNVYLDAVFFPNLLTDDRILKQEGWHYELNSIADDIIVNGVVYNEMKGAFSDPITELNYQNNRALFPDNTYGVESGGCPESMTSLTQEKFVAYYQKYYHPANSFILLYGDAKLDKELAFIDGQYLSKFSDNGNPAVVKPQEPFLAKKEIEVTYGVPEGTSVSDNTYLTYSVVAGLSTDAQLSMSLDLIAGAMVNHEAAPLRLALRESGIGKDVYAYSTSNMQNVFQITVTNANAADKEEFVRIVENTLTKAAAEGFDAETVDGLINRSQFNLREGNSPHKGLMALFSMVNSMWFNAEDPIAGLRFENTIASVKKGVRCGLLQDVVKNSLVNNPHTLITVMRPEQGKENIIAQQTLHSLNCYKKTLSRDQLEKLVADTRALSDFQNETDSPENLAKVPMLSLHDISSDVMFYQVKEKSILGTRALHFPDFTNNIVYANLFFNLQALPQELIPYAKLLSNLLGSMSTASYTYGELENDLNLHTGGVRPYIALRLEDNDDNRLVPQLVIGGKATVDKVQKLVDFFGEIINNTNYAEVGRLKELVTRHQASVENRMKNDGSRIATTRLQSYFSQSGMFNELTRGIDYYNFITEVKNKLQNNSTEVVENLNKTAKLLFNRQNLIIGATCSNENYAVLESAMSALVPSLPDSNGKTYTWNFNPQPKNEGFMSASNVQYVLQGYNIKQLGYGWNGKVRVLDNILSSGYLHSKIRIQGGAYGGYCSFRPSGNTFLASYRDPNLAETFSRYKEIPEFLKTFDVDNVEMTRFIIGTIANMESPTTPSRRGNIAVDNYFRRVTKAQMLAERKEVLSTTQADIRAFEKMMADIFEQNVYCVFGNNAKIQQNRNLFGSTYTIVK